jgi:hypothetical protein
MTEQRDDYRKCMKICSTASPKFANTLAPVNKLPPEILGMIPTYQEEPTPEDLVAISSVCSYWRSTFLANPSLWTKLDGKGIEKTRAWVKRSRALPIQLQVEDSPDPEVIEFLGAHSSRLEVVDLPKLEAQDLPLFTLGHLSRLVRPTPLLRDICIETSDPGTFDTPMTIGGEFPSLEVLRLLGFSVSIVNLSAPNLRKLLLTGTHDLARILDLLDSLPLLECLALRLDLQQRIPSDIGRKVVLGKLFQASFFHHGFEILQHLSLPAGSDIKMIEEVPVHHLDGTTNHYTRFLSRVLDDLPMCHQIDSISFHTMRGCRILLLSGPKGGLELVTPEIGDTTACITLLKLFARHSTETLQDLAISNVYTPLSNVHIISDFIKSLVGLRSLVMHQSFASRCLLALGTTHCLRLQNIHIQRPSPWLPDYPGLKKFVQDRSEAGIPIQRLLAVNGFPAPLDAEEMAALRKYVECVVWR